MSYLVEMVFKRFTGYFDVDGMLFWSGFLWFVILFLVITCSRFVSKTQSAGKGCTKAGITDMVIGCRKWTPSMRSTYKLSSPQPTRLFDFCTQRPRVALHAVFA